MINDGIVRGDRKVHHKSNYSPAGSKLDNSMPYNGRSRRFSWQNSWQAGLSSKAQEMIVYSVVCLAVWFAGRLL